MGKSSFYSTSMLIAGICLLLGCAMPSLGDQTYWSLKILTKNVSGTTMSTYVIGWAPGGDGDLIKVPPSQGGTLPYTWTLDLAPNDPNLHPNYAVELSQPDSNKTYPYELGMLQFAGCYSATYNAANPLQSPTLFATTQNLLVITAGVVPEPSSVIALLTGLSGLILTGRRFRR